ncbi:hypothetical protein [Shewanella sp. TC10]|uniref:hypothetical protein n=1 Tax=Shewanella sp. TC10 TaxID=1419739 RepID=UPI00129E3B6A|nr:hypothetical protein [Shewanella sp. TC10]
MIYPAASEQILEQHSIRKVSYFDKSRIDLSPKARLEAVRQSANDFRQYMLALDEQVEFYKSVDLIRVPYPTKYGLLNVETAKSPYLHILNRLFVIQYQTKQGLKTLLFSPSDIEGNGETPFFKNLRQSLGMFEKPMMNFLSPQLNDVEQALAKVGLKPENIDFISYDHLHTQDVRKWLGAHGAKGYFPNAKLLVMRQEWISTQALLPPQQTWYCPNGIDGIDPDKIILLDSSVMLGDSVALVQTPGHTEGNHSLVAHTADGLFVTSENGICADCYAPEKSGIKGVREFAKSTGMEVILNGNTLEGALEQYMSMVMEKTIAGPSKRNSDFPNVATSSEFTQYWGFPGLKPTFTVGELEYGRPFTNSTNK